MRRTYRETLRTLAEEMRRGLFHGTIYRHKRGAVMEIPIPPGRARRILRRCERSTLKGIFPTAAPG